MSDYEKALELAREYQERFSDNNYENIMDRDVREINQALIAAEEQLKEAEAIFEKFNRIGPASLCSGWLRKRRGVE